MNRLLIAIIIAVIAAFGSVFIFGGAMTQVDWLGELFLRSLKMLIVPLVVFSMISGITSLGDVRKLGKLGGFTLLYYFVTTASAVVVGMLVVQTMHPGTPGTMGTLTVPETVASKTDTGITDIILSLLSDNVVASMAELKLLPVILFSMLFAAVLTTVDKDRKVIQIFDKLSEVMLGMVHVVMWFAPIGIFGLIAGRFGEAVAESGMSGFMDQLQSVAWYMAAVFTGLGIHGLIVIPLLLWIFTKRNPLRYARGVSAALLTAFSTASSSATMPLMMECVEEENDVSPTAAKFVIPLGATVNMDGTALYEAVAVVFIAQSMGIDLTFGQNLLIVLTATLAAIGAAGIPEAGLVTMVIVLEAVHLPLEGVAMILSVDWLLDRFRTTINVWGDSVGAAILERFVPKESEIPIDSGESAHAT